MSNFRLVAQWMCRIDQDVPVSLKHLSDETVHLRESLISEEYAEVIEEMDKYRQALNSGDNIPIELSVNLVKELSDLLVVVYGTLAALGVDGDKAFQLVMENNFGKIEHGEENDIGKLVVPPEVKQRLKAEMYEKLHCMLTGEKKCPKIQAFGRGSSDEICHPPYAG